MIHRGLVIVLLCLVGPLSHPAASTPIDNDYFTAEQQPEMKELLVLVEINHLDRSPLNPKGIRGFIADRRYQNAIEDLKYTLDRFPNHPRALELMSVVSLLTKSPSLAIRYYEHAIRLYPQYALTRAQYGSHLVKIGRPGDGVEQLQEAIRMDPNLALAYGTLAKAYEKLGEEALGRQAAERAVALGYSGKLPYSTSANTPKP